MRAPKPQKGSQQAPTPTPPPPEIRPAPPASAPQGLSVDRAAIPVDAPGYDRPMIGPASYSKSAGDGTASFRVNCSFSHMRFDDPIVFPGSAGASHLHVFFGNTGVDASSTPESVRTTGNSTCTGGTANRTAYWVPAVVDTRTGAPVVAGGDEMDRLNFMQVYYKSGYDGVLPETIQNFPRGLRMIAGSAMSTGAQPGVVSYSCTGSGGPEVHGRASFPNCAPGQLFIMTVDFPQCWDGVNLDSPDHKSHMAYGAGWPDRGCPASHPVPLPKVTQNVRYRVPPSGMANWRLVSDMYDGPAGFSGHADWMNGWDEGVFQRVLDNCYRGRFDCRMNLLGDGQALLG